MTAPDVQAAKKLRRDIIADLLAVRGHLTEPYPDDPRWTPWDRFVERALVKVDELAALAARVAMLETALREIGRMGDYVYKPHEFAAVARAALSAADNQEQR